MHEHDFCSYVHAYFKSTPKMGMITTPGYRELHDNRKEMRFCLIGLNPTQEDIESAISTLLGGYEIVTELSYTIVPHIRALKVSDIDPSCRGQVI